MKFSIEAEQAVLGGLLQSTNKYDDLQEVITADDFHREDHKLIYSAIQSMMAKGMPVDAITLTEYMIAEGTEHRAGGLNYLIVLVQNTPGASNVLAYAQIVADRAMERKIAVSGQRLFEIAETEGVDVDEKLNMVHSEFSSLERNDRSADAVDFNVLLKAEVNDVDGRFRKTGKTGLKTGFEDLDARFGGIEDTDLWVLAARPSMGKTALALNLAYNVAKQGKQVLIFSLEMSKEQLTKRLLSAASGIPYGLLRSGDLVEQHWPLLAAGVAKLKDQRLTIIDIPAIDINRAIAISRKYARAGNLGLVIFDYLQLITAKSQTRFDEVSYVSRQLKVLAKTVKAPVLALSQLSRKCEERGNKRPINSDLRESGQIEQDADIISFLYRDVVHNPNTNTPNVAELITSKFRNGEAGVDGLGCELQFSRFTNLGYQFVQTFNDEPKKKSMYGG